MNVCLTMYRYDGRLSSMQEFFDHPFAGGSSEASKKEEERSADPSKAVSGHKIPKQIDPPRKSNVPEGEELIDTTPDLHLRSEAKAKGPNPATSAPPRQSHTDDLLGLEISTSEALAEPIKADAIKERPKSGAQGNLAEIIDTLLGEAKKSPEIAEEMLKILMPLHQQRITSGQTSAHSSSATTNNTPTNNAPKPQAGALSVFVDDKYQKWADDTRATETSKSRTIFGEHISRTRFTRRDPAVSSAPPLSPEISGVAERFQNLNLNEAIAPVSLIKPIS